jgi:hypothetical protein
VPHYGPHKRARISPSPTALSGELAGRNTDINSGTKADKAWEARQEAARYRIFNARISSREYAEAGRRRSPALDSHEGGRYERRQDD